MYYFFAILTITIISTRAGEIPSPQIELVSFNQQLLPTSITLSDPEHEETRRSCWSRLYNCFRATRTTQLPARNNHTDCLRNCSICTGVGLGCGVLYGPLIECGTCIVDITSCCIAECCINTCCPNCIVNNATCWANYARCLCSTYRCGINYSILRLCFGPC